MKNDDDSRACVKLMMTQKIVKFEIKDGRVVKMLLVGLSDTLANRIETV